MAVEATYTKNHVSAGISLNELRKYLSRKFGIVQKKVLVVPVTGALVACNEKMQSDLFGNAGYHTACIMPNGDLYAHLFFTLEEKN